MDGVFGLNPDGVEFFAFGGKIASLSGGEGLLWAVDNVGGGGGGGFGPASETVAFALEVGRPESCGGVGRCGLVVHGSGGAGAVVKVADFASGAVPLGVESDVLVGAGEGNFLFIGVVGAGAVGLGVPADEAVLVIAGCIGVFSEGGGGVFGDLLGRHLGAGAAVRVKGDIIVINAGWASCDYVGSSAVVGHFIGAGVQAEPDIYSPIDICCIVDIS